MVTDTRRKKSDEVDFVGTWKLSRDRTWQASQKNAKSTTKINKFLLENFVRKSQTITKWLKNNDTRYVSLAHLRRQVRETHVCLHARAPFHIFLSPVIVFLSFTSTFFFLLALLFRFSRLSWFVFDRSRRYRFLFFFFLPFLVKWVSPRLREFYKKRGEARGARRETLFFFCFISIAIEYLATDTDHDRSRKKIALARRGTDRARRQHRRGPWAGVYGVDRAATLVARPLPAPSEGHGPRKRVHIRYTHGNLSQELVTIVIN